jgi:hypothetical protein
MKARLPVWRHNFGKEATKKSMPLKAAGGSGRRTVFRQNRNSNCFLVLSRPPHAGRNGQVRKNLRVNTGIGGMARYEGDNYQRVNGDAQAIPGSFAPLWMADFLAERAGDETAIAEAVEFLEWAAEHWINTLYADTCDTIYKMRRV